MTFGERLLLPIQFHDRTSYLTELPPKAFYCAPERFNRDLVRDSEIQQITAVTPHYLVIDEAHCIDKWGSDFRPSYAKLGAVRRQLGQPPVLAFTASAGRQTQQRILDSLGIPDAAIFVQDVDRPNIALARYPLAGEPARYNFIGRLLDLCTQGRMMIFVPTVKIGEALAQGLAARGYDVPFYHSKLRPSAREFLQQRFMGRVEPDCRAIICTNAFGMGLDVPDVRLVVHWQHPASLEDYLQEFGRAGRDGQPALAVVLTAPDDLQLPDYMLRLTLEGANLSAAERASAWREKQAALIAMNRATQDHNHCFRGTVLDYFVDPGMRPRRSWGLRLLNWLYGARADRRVRQRCCDVCDQVSAKNFWPWAAGAMGQALPAAAVQRSPPAPADRHR